MSDVTGYEVFMAVYDNEDRAKATLGTLKDMDKAGSIEVIDAAVISKDNDGKVHVVETAELTTKKAAKRGAVIGVVLGLIFPPSLIATGLAGGVVGALVGRFTDTGLFDNSQLKEAAESLPPGSSAIIGVFEDKWVEQMNTALEGYANLSMDALDADFAADALAVGEEE
jgi:uncharacterized membrane protein